MASESGRGGVFRLSSDDFLADHSWLVILNLFQLRSSLWLHV